MCFISRPVLHSIYYKSLILQVCANEEQVSLSRQKIMPFFSYIGSKFWIPQLLCVYVCLALVRIEPPTPLNYSVLTLTKTSVQQQLVRERGGKLFFPVPLDGGQIGASGVKWMLTQHRLVKHCQSINLP